MGKLWDKGYELNALVELFTVGEDYILDRSLVSADCIASIAHAKMLSAIGIVTEREFTDLHRELAAVIRESGSGSFVITRDDEDCHTAIENRLTASLGDSGKKVHTGRSRNDQVLAATRLYTKSYLFDCMEAVLSLAEQFFSFAELHKEVPMPGRTHLHAGMPSSVGLWAAAFGEDLLDAYSLLESAFRLNDQSPLGSAASYGVPLPLDRELTAKLLGFGRVQNNVLYVQNSRGKIESAVLYALDYVMTGLSKAAWDIIIFSLPEFGYFSLPEEICSGSSIMPQKKNPDVLELIRSKAAVLAGYLDQVRNIVRPLYSGYNRDFQDTKGPLLKGLEIGFLSVSAMELTMKKLKVNPDRLREGFPPEIFATDYTLELVRQGKSFRDAYKEVAANISSLRLRDPDSTIGGRTSSGTSGNLRIGPKGRELLHLRGGLREERRKFQETLKQLTGFDAAVHTLPRGAGTKIDPPSGL